MPRLWAKRVPPLLGAKATTQRCIVFSSGLSPCLCASCALCARGEDGIHERGEVRREELRHFHRGKVAAPAHLTVTD